jgi:hypothetical protein
MAGTTQIAHRRPVIPAPAAGIYVLSHSDPSHPVAHEVSIAADPILPRTKISESTQSRNSDIRLLLSSWCFPKTSYAGQSPDISFCAPRLWPRLGRIEAAAASLREALENRAGSRGSVPASRFN